MPSPTEHAEMVLLMSDNASGGAAAATARLLAGLAGDSVSAEWWHFSPPSQLADGLPVTSLDPRRKRPPFERAIKNVSLPFANRLRRRRHRKIFRDAFRANPPALVNCHNIHSCGLNHEDLLWIPRQVPVVWTLHDCWPFRYRAFEWRNLITGAVEFLCEDLPEAAARQRRVRFFESRPDVVLIAPSRWIASEARNALGPNIRIEHIPYGISGQKFRPMDQPAARMRLGLSEDKIWLGTAATHAYSRKGLDVLAAALRLIDTSKLGLLSWGQKPDLEFPPELEIKRIGSVSAEEEIAALYAACDFFVCPSRSDNLPNAVLESLACGVPVIGSDAGGIPDMVRPGETGWLFQSDQPASCAAAIQAAIADRPLWNGMKTRCRNIALAEYSLEKQAAAYNDLFRELLHRDP